MYINTREHKPKRAKINPDITMLFQWSSLSKSSSIHSPMINKAEAHSKGKKWNFEKSPIIPVFTWSSGLNIVLVKNIIHPPKITNKAKIKTM